MLLLNQWGRCHFRDPNTCTTRLIELILEIPSDERDSVLYGLLRELPELWCRCHETNTTTAAVTGKRKYSQVS